MKFHQLDIPVGFILITWIVFSVTLFGRMKTWLGINTENGSVYLRFMLESVKVMCDVILGILLYVVYQNWTAI